MNSTETYQEVLTQTPGSGGRKRTSIFASDTDAKEETEANETQASELNEGKPVPWWRRGPRAGLVSFGNSRSKPSCVSCFIIGKICAYLDKEVGELVEITAEDKEEYKKECDRVRALAARAMERLEKSLLEPLREDNRFRRRYRIVSIEDIQAEKTEMVVDPILPRGEVTILDGDPGAGKSWFWMALLAGLTGSKVCPLPESLRGANEIRSALILTTEDDPARIIRPRLEGLGADLKRIKIVQFASEEEMFFTASDARDIQRLVKENTPDIVIVDPITLYASTEKGFDSKNAEKVRKMLTPLIKIARETNCAFLVNRHFRKTSGKAMHQGIGSIDYAATARSLLMIVKDPTDRSGNPRIMAHVKSTASPEMREGLMFSLDENQTPPFQWEGVCEVSPDELTDYEGACNAREDRSRTDEAKDFLREILAGGQLVPIQECKEQANRLGIADTTLLRAKRELGVKAKQSGFGQDKAWFWCLE